MPKPQHSLPNELTTAQTAAVLGCDVRTVHRMIRRGHLVAKKLPGATGAYLFDRADVEVLASTRLGARGERVAS